MNSTCQAKLPTRNSSNTIGGNETTPCVFFNLCDQLTVNLTSAQVSQFYNATKSNYADIRSYLSHEWRNFTERLLADGFGSESFSSENQTTENTASAWDNYVSSSQSRVSQFMDAMNNTWMEIRQISDALVDPEFSKTISSIEKKVSRRFNKLAKTINKGLDAVKTGFSSHFSSASATAGQQRNNQRDGSQSQEADSSEKDRNKKRPEYVKESRRGKATKKFESRLKKLRDELSNLDSWRVERMKR